MNSGRVHVSRIVRVAPPHVELSDGAQVQLDLADQRAVPLVGLLRGVERLGQPVYLEVDVATSMIVRVLIPLIVRVIDVRTDADGDCQVELEPSAGVHRLLRSRPDFSAIEAELRGCSTTKALAIVTENDAHEIVHVRRFLPGADGPPPPLPPRPAP